MRRAGKRSSSTKSIGRPGAAKDWSAAIAVLGELQRHFRLRPRTGLPRSSEISFHGIPTGA